MDYRKLTDSDKLYLIEELAKGITSGMDKHLENAEERGDREAYGYLMGQKLLAEHLLKVIGY